jgi:hypothetical protein
MMSGNTFDNAHAPLKMAHSGRTSPIKDIKDSGGGGDAGTGSGSGGAGSNGAGYDVDVDVDGHAAVAPLHDEYGALLRPRKRYGCDDLTDCG